MGSLILIILGIVLLLSLTAHPTARDESGRRRLRIEVFIQELFRR